MTPAETIAAAIEKLEAQRDAAEMGNLEVLRFDDGRLEDVWIDSKYEHPSGARTTYRTAVIFDRNQGHLRFAAADLIVTLHRTIDAQLKTLRDVSAARLFETNWPTLVYTENALDLARAILGEEA